MNVRFYLLGLISLILVTACQQDSILVEQRILSFGTLIDITIATTQANKANAEQAIQDAETLLKKRHHQWHAWLPGDLSSLNLALSKNTAVQTNKDIEFLIQQSKQYFTDTNGLFNPAMGLLIEAWGFHDPTPPNQQLIAKITQNMPTMDQVLIDEHQIKSLNPFVQLDFGGIAKGLAIDQIKTILKDHQLNDYLINIGGDLFASGLKHNKSWVAGIQNPYQPGAIATFPFKHNSNLFTSGNYERFSLHNNKRLHHIINPRTGEPSHQANAVTVNHPNALTADVAATALMIAKPNEWQVISRQLGVHDYLIMMPDKTIWVSRSLFKKLTFNTELKVHIIDE